MFLKRLFTTDNQEQEALNKKNNFNLYFSDYVTVHFSRQQYKRICIFKKMPLFARVSNKIKHIDCTACITHCSWFKSSNWPTDLLGLRPLPPVAVSLEVEPQLEDPISKLTAKTVSVGVFPLPVYNFKSNVLIRRTCMEPQNPKVLVVRTGLEEVLRGRALVNQVWVEDVKLVTLDNLGRWVVEVVMRLVVFVPLKASVDPVEKAWFPGTIFVSPQVHFTRDWELHAKLGLIVAHTLSGTTYKSIFSTLIGVPCYLQLSAC